MPSLGECDVFGVTENIIACLRALLLEVNPKLDHFMRCS